MQALVPSGVGLPAPDCSVLRAAGDKPIPLSSVITPKQRQLVLLASVFAAKPLLEMLAETAADSTVIITGDSPQALEAAQLPSNLAVYCDPSLSFARLYGISCAPTGCHFGYFLLQQGWIKQSFICEQIELPIWRALLTR